MNQFSLVVPIYVVTGVKKKKKHFLNLNLLRNREHHTNNNVKKQFKREIIGLLPTNTYYNKFSVDYELFLPNKLKRDIANVLSIVDKNFCDVLVEEGLVPEDNYEHLQKVAYRYGGMDENKEGYVLVTVTEEE